MVCEVNSVFCLLVRRHTSLIQELCKLVGFKLEGWPVEAAHGRPVKTTIDSLLFSVYRVYILTGAWR